MLSFSQFTHLLIISLKSIPNRLITFLIGVIGISGVIVIAIGIFSIVEGFSQTTKTSSADDLVIVLRAFAVGEMNSYFLRNEVDNLIQAEGILSDADGPIISPELFVTVQSKKKPHNTEANLPFRGVTHRAFEVRGNITMIEGRRFNPGEKEIIIGKAAKEQLVGFNVGSEKTWGSDVWTVVGVFEANGGVPESEIWTDVKVLQSAFNRGSTYQTVRLKLESKDSFDLFDTWVSTNPALTARVVKEQDFYSEQSEFFTKFVSTVGGFIVLLIALGTTFGAINTMYTMISNLEKEISTFRALGFSNNIVLSTVVVESMIIGLLGGLLGVFFAYLLIDGYKVSTLNAQSFTQLAFSFRVSIEIVMISMCLAALIGLLGGLVPGYIITRKSVVKGLSAL